MKQEYMEDAQRQYEREKDLVEKNKTIRIFLMQLMTFALLHFVTVVLPSLIEDETLKDKTWIFVQQGFVIVVHIINMLAITASFFSPRVLRQMKYF